EPRLEAGARREHVRVEAHERAAVPPLPDPGLRDEVGRAREDRSRDAPEALVERYVDRVEEARDLRVGTGVEGAALPEPRAVEVEGSALGARPRDDVGELLPRGELAADLALRQLHEERGQRHGDAVEIAPAEEARRLPDEHAVQPVERGVA